MKTKVLVELVGVVIAYFAIGYIARRIFGHPVMTPTALVTMILTVAISNLYAYFRRVRRLRRRASRLSD